MKRLVSAFLPFFFAVFGAMGQNGNEWIEYSQPYVKIPIGKDGLYRVSFESLQNAGFQGGDPKKLQLFHRGKEQAIYVQGEGDGSFDSGDYIEFYGRRNDGTLDSTLYAGPSHQPHRYYNLFSDTTAYFLTSGNSEGKRMAAYSGSPIGLTAETFQWAEKFMVLNQSYAAGAEYGSVLKSNFDMGEGWTGAQILHGREVTYTLDGITNISPTSGKPTLEVLLTGRGPMSHDVQISVGSRLLSTITFSGFASHTYIQQLEWTDIDASGKLLVTIRVTGANGPDRVSTGYLRLTFPQEVTMAGTNERVFSVDPATGDVLLKIQSSPPDVRVFDITDPTSPVRISTQLGATLDAVINSAGIPRELLVTAQVLSPSSIKKVAFRQINPAIPDYIIITHPSLRRPALGYIDPVKAYAEYRSLPEGGGYDTLVVNIDQLYDQFNYGEASPRAIYQFMKFCASVKLPDFLFLVGKGLDINYDYRRTPSAFVTYRDLVPTGGYPASDVLFTTGLSGIDNVPAVATGRLTANSPADVASYLNKVKERDALPFNDLNRKKILHLSGGIEETEPALFRQILQNYEVVAEDLFLGGYVQAISKQSTGVKLINVADEVNAGVGMVTFFGHSAPNTLDFDIGRVSDPVMGYNNTKKYPFMLMNGCDAGSYFLNTSIIGEDWINTPNKGAIGFMAHSHYGLIYALDLYSSTFYQVAFGDSTFISRGVGKVQQEVARRILQADSDSPPLVSQVQQMGLLGDPAISIFGASKPDYAPIEGNIVVKPFADEPVTALSDSFRIEFPVRNYGVARPENIRINIRREYNGGQVLEYDTIITSVLFEDTVRMTLKNRDTDGYGINVFSVQVDADDLIDEMNESNNTATFDFFIPLNSTRNLFPYNYSIVSQRDVQVSFQFTDPLSGPRDFIVQIDTTKGFDSPFLQEFLVNAHVLARQSVVLSDRDSVVYFWRTKIADPLENESMEWAVSSFTYIDNGDEGWAQLHFHQRENNSSVGLVSDPELRRMEFQETVSDIAIRTFTSSAGHPIDSVSFRINGAEFNLLSEGPCRFNTINLIAFDRRSTQPYAGIYFKWYELLYEYGGRMLLCGREPYVINSFKADELVTGNNDDLLQYIDNIHAGDTVVLFNMGDAGYAQWPAAAKAKLGELGISSAQLDALQNGNAVVIFGRKGSPAGTAQVYQATGGDLSVNVERTIAGRFTSGSLSSGMIGPAQRWDRFIPRVKGVEDVDEFSFTVVGIGIDGDADTLRTDITAEVDLSFIDPLTYPYMKVVFNTADNVNVTAVQLKNWLVLFEPVAEGMVIHRDAAAPRVVAEGESVYSDFGFVNVSDKAFPDSLLVRFDVVNHAHDQEMPAEFRIKSPSPGDTTLFTIPIETRGKSGTNDLQIFVNPRMVPEKTFDNNFIFLPQHLDVQADQTGPVLDVTFDGRHLEDNDYVSTNPSIVIRVWDENAFMPVQDTVGLRILLAGPCEGDDCNFEAVYFSRDDIEWSTATDTSGFVVEFSPKDLETGIYRLSVEAQDASGNVAGQVPYQIGFRVDHDRTVAVSYAYPNPFLEETNIDVIVTGDRELSYSFGITTSSGSVVMEFDGDPGMLHVGRNTITWDGTGPDGTVVPNGLYFYRLVIRDGGSESTYYGKLVLVR